MLMLLALFITSGYFNRYFNRYSSGYFIYQLDKDIKKREG